MRRIFLAILSLSGLIFVRPVASSTSSTASNISIEKPNLIALHSATGGYAINKLGSPTRSNLQSLDPESASNKTSIVLDNVEISIQTRSFPYSSFVVSDPGAVNQVATSEALHPYREISITAIPLGHQSGTEALPIAYHGSAEAYRIALYNYRIQQGARIENSPVATLFGRQVTGLSSVVELYVDGPNPMPVLIDEWVVEAGKRIWIVRASEEQVSNDFANESTKAFKDLVISSNNTLANPTSVSSSQSRNPRIRSTSPVTTADLPTPPWWNGDCDYNTYLQKSKGIGSYRLGAVYLGMPACGPRPTSDSGPDVLVSFFPGAWGEYEWECVELVMRFLYLMYGISPYQANGSQAVWNYSGTGLSKIANGSIGQAPQPNDVLSYGSTSTFGHASVVTASNVDTNGNGTVTVIEQNNSASGSSILSVADWWVQGNAGSVSGWLQKNTTFSDVPDGYWAYTWIESLYNAGITGGCSITPLNYCPDSSVTRDQMAVFLERGMHGSSFNPPTVPLTFTDTTGDFAQYWIEALKADGITSGCGTNLYCPTADVTRAQMAIFLLKSEHGSSYTPPPATGTKFTDVPATYWAASWIEQLANEGITSGCATNLYCPDQSVTRAQMAVFLVKTFNLP